MTCIVALIDGGKVYLGGDSAATEKDTGLIVQRTDPKVFKVGQYGIGRSEEHTSELQSH